jgi:Repair protein Rad1/Rec1/Rad17
MSENLNILELNTSNIQVACKVTNKNVKFFISIIRSFLFTNNAEIQLSPSGIKYCAEESQFFQANAYIKTSFFETFKYYLDEEVTQLTFGINLSKFAEFLNAFIDNDSSSLKIICYGNSLPMAFVITQFDTGDIKSKRKSSNNDSDLGTTFYDPEEDRKKLGVGVGEICTEYIIQTKEPINPVNHKQTESQMSSQLVINAKILYEQLMDFDSKSVESVAVLIKDHCLVLKSVGCVYGSTSIKIKFENNNIFYRSKVTNTSRFCYKYACFKSLMKGMILSSKVCLDTYENGLLMIQMMMRTKDAEDDVYLEYYICCNVQDSDEF